MNKKMLAELFIRTIHSGMKLKDEPTKLDAKILKLMSTDEFVTGEEAGILLGKLIASVYLECFLLLEDLQVLDGVKVLRELKELLKKEEEKEGGGQND